jgi:DNA polymerase-1
MSATRHTRPTGPPMPDDLVVQLPWIRKVTEAFNIPVFEKAGYEADDLIGALARRAEKHGFHVVMVTGDKDFMQLVTDRCTIWDPMKDKIIDPAVIRETFDLDAPQMIDVMGLSGDTADNIPGVPGIGQKTAVRLIQTFGSMDGVYEGIETITAKKQKEKLLQFKDQALLSRELVTIDRNAPVAFDPQQLKRQKPDDGGTHPTFCRTGIPAVAAGIHAPGRRRGAPIHGHPGCQGPG